MPARVIVSLILIAIVGGGATILASQFIGIPLASVALVAVLAALAVRVWMDRR